MGRPGSGKTTVISHVRRLLTHSEPALKSVYLTDDDFVQSRLDNPKQAVKYDRVKVLRDALDDLANRAKALKGMNVVFCDFARHSYLEAIDQLDTFQLVPDLAVYISATPAIAMQRITERGKRGGHLLPAEVMAGDFSSDDIDGLRKSLGDRLFEVANDEDGQDAVDHVARLIVIKICHELRGRNGDA